YKFAEMIAYFTGLAIFIACLGLFGMSLFVIQRRVKEIGVRKVLGASVASILLSTAKEFVILLLISTVLSLPISIYFMDKWLNEYAYHINVNVVSVLITFAAGLIIVLLTISYQALNAARANPIKALRYE
ncbi:MAG: FtsX-like permease family protein, partial [Bacteroidetes bacterium]|nr:FtsX-like permease family protein [Bacteroidota bacterium]